MLIWHNSLLGRGLREIFTYAEENLELLEHSLKHQLWKKKRTSKESSYILEKEWVYKLSMKNVDNTLSHVVNLKNNVG